MVKLADIANGIASTTQGNSGTQYRIILDTRKPHPYGVRHRLQFFAHKANRHLEVAEHGKHTTILTIHHGR